jgi:hypothetical protein
VVRLAPDNANAYQNLKFSFIKAGRVDSAIETASKSIRIRPVPPTYSTPGRALLYRGYSRSLAFAIVAGESRAESWASFMKVSCLRSLIFTLLRQDPEYGLILKQFHFESVDPDGLMLNTLTCPELPIQPRR